MKLFNRIITWAEDGIIYEADQRHMDLIIRDLGLSGASKSVTTPSAREEGEIKEDDYPLEPNQLCCLKAL